MQVIDYQNKTQHQRPSVVISGDQPSFPSSSTSQTIKTEDFFPRKVIEYDHKSKVYPWSSFCPIFQFDYNHTQTGLSLHEHPPPKPVEKRIEQPHFVKTEPHFMKTEPKDEESPFRQPKWMPGPSERQERFSYAAQGERYYQSRYENRPNAAMNIQSTTDNHQYYRRNPQEKNWPRNAREYSSQDSYGYEK